MAIENNNSSVFIIFLDMTDFETIINNKKKTYIHGVISHWTKRWYVTIKIKMVLIIANLRLNPDISFGNINLYIMWHIGRCLFIAIREANKPVQMRMTSRHHSRVKKTKCHFIPNNITACIIKLVITYCQSGHWRIWLPCACAFLIR